MTKAATSKTSVNWDIIQLVAVLPAKRDSDVMFCYKVIRGLYSRWLKWSVQVNVLLKETKSATMNIFHFFFIFFLNHL